MGEIVTLKLQRPLMTSGSYAEVMSYIVDEDDEQTSNPFVEQMSQEDIELLFGDHYKVYYLGEYTKGRPVEIYAKNPTRQDEWV